MRHIIQQSKRWQVAASAVILCAVIGSLFFIVFHVTAAHRTSNPAMSAATIDGYRVTGNKITNASGRTIMLHGIDQSGLEFNCSDSLPAASYATMKSAWNANAVRISVDQDFWLTDASHTCSGYQATVNAAVQAVRAQHMIAIIDLHWSDQGNLAAAPAQQCMPDQNSVSFWQQVAEKYKTNPNVWFELYNEPHPNNWTIWKNGGSVCGFHAVGMQTLLNTVRNTGARNIVLAGGDNYASNLDGVQLLRGTNIAYAVHPYAAQTGNNSWSNSDWDKRFGNVATKVPVISTEFGDFQCGGSYDQGILDYFRSHTVGYTAWAWLPNGCSYPSLLSDTTGDCAPSMGCTIQQDMLKYPIDNF